MKISYAKLLLICVTITGLVSFLNTPMLFILSEQGVYTWFFVKSPMTFSLHFTHSVQRTPVIENFSVADNGDILLSSTEYQSLGVGLPFLPEEGTFRQEGAKFILENMNRSFQAIDLKVGTEAKLSFHFRGIQYNLYDGLPYGSTVRLEVSTWHSYIQSKYFCDL